MCGPPLLYLEKCGHKMTPRFPAPGNTSIYLSIRDKSKACLMRALLLFIGIPYKITLRMIRFVMKVCQNASLTLVVVQI